MDTAFLNSEKKKPTNWSAFSHALANYLAAGAAVVVVASAPVVVVSAAVVVVSAAIVVVVSAAVVVVSAAAGASSFLPQAAKVTANRDAINKVFFMNFPSEITRLCDE
jgi:hypothetical protein